MRDRVGAAVLLVCALVTGLVLSTPATSEAASSVRVSRTQAIPGETIEITGSTGVRVARTVQLQRRDGSRWVTLASSRTTVAGAFRFRYRAPWKAGVDTGLRVRAPRTKVRSRTHRALVVGSGDVRTVPQTASAMAPSTAVVGDPFDVTGRFTPARPGRPTRVQYWDGEHWTALARGTQDAGGRTTFSVSMPLPGTARLRAVVDEGAGMAYQVSDVVRVRVDEPLPLPAPERSACGDAVLKPDGTPWTCTFADDFDGDELDPAAWVPQTHFATGTASAFACYRDDPRTIAVSDGALHLTVRRVEDPVGCSFAALSGSTHLVAGSVMTYQRFSQQHGRFEARMRTSATRVQGLHEAFWLWPDDRFPSEDTWPAAGEIDIAETYSAHPDLVIPFLHYRTATGEPENGVDTAYCPATRGEWNTYTLVWSADRIEIAVNGSTCLVNTSGDVAFLKPYIMALTSGIGAVGNRYDGRAALPATTDVDYVRVWR
jgi:hypothetical protein